jgi:hypothetical protein
MTASASFGCSNTDYKGESFTGSTDDGCGYKLVGRVGGGVMQPILDKPEKGEPVGSEGRPVNTIEVEAGYVKHGDLDFNGLWLGTPDTGTVEADGFLLGIIYTRRITSAFDLFAGGGAHWWDVEESEVFGGTPEQHDASGTSPYFELGGRYWLGPNAAIRASWERFTDVGKINETGEGDIDSWWLGIDYRF